MAEFCVDCWNSLAGTNLSAEKYVLSKELDVCEECGKYKPIVIMEKKYY
ncbi:MAG: hypothetical protein IKU56_02220 [Clostridia bacterium]|nr:hypothetical protein [Clostridia bacterium]